MEIEKQIFQMAKSQAVKKLDDKDYRLPEQLYEEEGKYDFKKKYELLTKRYDNEEIVVNDQDMWEQEQQKNAEIKTTANVEQKKEYDIVVEN